MNEDLVLHQTTQTQLQQLVHSPSHAVLLAGPDGIGKTAVARGIAAQLLQLPTEKLAVYPYFSVISSGNGSISIEAVRGMQKFLQLKTIGAAPLRRAVVVEHAGGLTIEAQNALLKLLEEPPDDTVILLTAQSKRSLLPTIVSRVRTITVHTPERKALQTHFLKANKEESAVTSAYFLSGGLPGLMSGLLDNESEHPLLAQVATAKDILQKSVFERLAMADALAKQKPELERLLEALLRIAGSGLQQTSEKQDTQALKRWHNIRKEVLYAQNALAHSANSKLVLTKLLLHI